MPQSIGGFVLMTLGCICFGEGEFYVRVRWTAMGFKHRHDALRIPGCHQRFRMEKSHIVAENRVRISLIEALQYLYRCRTLLLIFKSSGSEIVKVIPEHRSQALGVLPCLLGFGIILILSVGTAQQEPC